MSVELKIKSKHLAEESRIIRKEETRIKKVRSVLKEKIANTTCSERQSNLSRTHFKLGRTLDSICEHRRWDVRNENRATFLARAYIQGRKYSEVESPNSNKGRLSHVVPRVKSMVNKYGNRDVKISDIYDWINNK